MTMAGAGGSDKMAGQRNRARIGQRRPRRTTYTSSNSSR
jgi:hypothetical protein